MASILRFQAIRETESGAAAFVIALLKVHPRSRGRDADQFTTASAQGSSPSLARARPLGVRKAIAEILPQIRGDSQLESGCPALGM